MILISVALSFEATPLIRALQLKLIEKGSFSLYGNSLYRLLVTGVGKLAMAAGTAYLYAVSKDFAIEGFLNIGIAGHKDLPLGTCILAHKIIDAPSKKADYPHLPLGWKEKSGVIASVDQPEKVFADNHLYEMEASAFFRTAIRFSTVERIQVLKIVSDNSLLSFSHLTKEKVSSLIEQNLPLIFSLLEKMKELGKPHFPPDLSSLFEKIHFTETEKNQLVKLSEKLSALDPAFHVTGTGFSSSSDLLSFYEKKLMKHPL